MEDVKFRGMAIYPYKKQWWYGFYVKSDYMGKSFITSNAIEAINHETSGAIAFAHFCEVDPKTVGQYTGFKAFGGPEIYDNDIVDFQMPGSSGNIIGLVSRNQDGTWVIADSFILSHWATSCKIIGNIHEHPQLINQ